MSKKRSNSDNILLPETVVTPHGGYTNFTGEETILPSLEYFKKAEINKDRVKAIGKMLSLEAPVDPKNPDSSKPSMLALIMQRFSKIEVKALFCLSLKHLVVILVTMQILLRDLQEKLSKVQP